MIKVARDGYPKPILESADINAVRGSVYLRSARELEVLIRNPFHESPRPDGS